MFRLAPFAAAVVLLGGCIQYLGPGEIGTGRYFWEIEGDDPLPVLPPISDRDGNVYILAGSLNQPDVEVFVGHAGGGGSAGCDLDDKGHNVYFLASGKAWAHHVESG